MLTEVLQLAALRCCSLSASSLVHTISLATQLQHLQIQLTPNVYNKTISQCVISILLRFCTKRTTIRSISIHKLTYLLKKNCQFVIYLPYVQQTERIQSGMHLLCLVYASVAVRHTMKSDWKWTNERSIQVQGITFIALCSSSLKKKSSTVFFFFCNIICA